MAQFTWEVITVMGGLWAAFILSVLSASVVFTYHMDDEGQVDNTSLLWFVRVGSLLILSFFGLMVLSAMILGPIYYYYKSKTRGFQLLRFRIEPPTETQPPTKTNA